MDGIISLEKAQFFIRGKAGISKIERDLNKRREKLEKLMQTGPFWRSMDKIAYILGTGSQGATTNFMCSIEIIA